MIYAVNCEKWVWHWKSASLDIYLLPRRLFPISPEAATHVHKTPSTTVHEYLLSQIILSFGSRLFFVTSLSAFNYSSLLILHEDLICCVLRRAHIETENLLHAHTGKSRANTSKALHSLTTLSLALAATADCAVSDKNFTVSSVSLNRSDGFEY